MSWKFWGTLDTENLIGDMVEMEARSDAKRLDLGE